MLWSGAAALAAPTASPREIQKVTIAQITVGRKVAENLAHMRMAFQQAKADGADWILFPECALSGYYGGFDQREVAVAFEEVRGLCRDASVVGLIGTGWRDEGGKPQNQVRVVGRDGNLVGRYAKTCLTFSDARAFAPGGLPMVHDAGGVRFGTLICNGMWVTPGFTDGPNPHLSRQIAKAGARVLFHAVSSGSGERYRGYHENNLFVRAAEARCRFVVANSAGREDVNCTSGIVGTEFAYEASLPRRGDQVATLRFALKDSASDPLRL
jgi:predicted amidohydrolase